MTKLRTVLTYGWDEKSQAGVEAESLHSRPGSLEKNLMNTEGAILIKNLDRLFRRTPARIRTLSQFVSALLDVSRRNNKTIDCSIDAFAYAYLVGAKNYDFFMEEIEEESKDIESPFRKIESEWRKKIVALERFERFGETSGDIDDRIKARYLVLRKIVSRPSARDERRTLVVLLYSGPSTAQELADELSLNESLIQRVVHSLHGAEIVDGANGKFQLAADNLPIVLFLLRETMGVDPMSSLKGGA